MGAQTAISFSYDTTLAVVTSDLQKLDFASSGTVTLSRPDKIRVTRTGGFADVEMVYDGKPLSILGKNVGKYAQVDGAGNDRRSSSIVFAITGARRLAPTFSCRTSTTR